MARGGDMATDARGSLTARDLSRALLTLVAALAFLAAGALCLNAGVEPAYPPARLGDVVDDYHGIEVPDPYRWLEDEESEETVAWVEAQNKLLEGYVSTPEREQIEKRLTTLMDYEKFSLPTKKGGRYFFWRNTGLQDQWVMYVQDTLEGEPVLVMDPNTFSEDGTIGVTRTSLSEDSNLIAYCLTEGGSDWQTLRIREVNTGREFPETIERVRFAHAAWEHDNSGFYYSRHPQPGTVPPEDEINFSRVYWHVPGTLQSEDELIYERPDDKELDLSPVVSDDGNYLVLYVYKGSDNKNRLYYRETKSVGEFVRLLDDHDSSYYFIDNIGSVFYIQTELDAPHGRVVAIDLEKPQRHNWKEIVPEQEDVLSSASIVNNRLVISYTEDAHYALRVFDLDGTFAKEIELPAIGSVYGMGGRREDTEMFVSFTSFLHPSSQFIYDFESGEMTLFRSSGIDFDPSGFETKQVFYKSKDGTRVPMFITHKRGLALDGSNPTELNGYGGFAVSQTPYFSTSNVVWMENGGVYALACIRGGGEYGEDWHEAAKLEKRQNSFDDFIAAGEWLIDNGYTDRSRLAISGGSNGGLLVAACMTQRPELFGAIICQAPLTDMLRYHRLGPGRYWTAEFGNAEQDPDHFDFIYAYSPLHNVEKGTKYPATLITAADHDDRVIPSHAKKFAAALQAADAGGNPILMRIETKAGHWVGTPLSKRIAESTDVFAFLFRTFGMEFTGPN